LVHRERVGKLREDEREEAARLHAYSFPSDPSAAQRVLDCDLSRAFAVRDGRRLVAVVLWRAVDLIAGDLRVPFVATGPGTTAVDVRGRGLLAEEQTTFLELLRADALLSGIGTPQARWHQRNGWGVATSVQRITEHPEVFAGGSHRLDRFVQCDADDLEVRTLWRRHVETRVGAIDRGPDEWAALLVAAPSELRRDLVKCQVDGATVAYLLLAHRPAPTGDELRVLEGGWDTEAGVPAVLAALSSHNNVERVVWDAPSDLLLWPHVRAAMRFEPTVVPDKMLRILDLARMPWRAPAGTPDASVTVEVVDVQAPWNAGSWEVGSDAGTVSWQRTSRTPKITVQASVLGPLYSGFATPHVARASGLLHASDERSLDLLELILHRPSAPYAPDCW
jgi:predicted acetyltransferase